MVNHCKFSNLNRLLVDVGIRVGTPKKKTSTKKQQNLETTKKNTFGMGTSWCWSSGTPIFFRTSEKTKSPSPTAKVRQAGGNSLRSKVLR